MPKRKKDNVMLDDFDLGIDLDFDEDFDLGEGDPFKAQLLATSVLLNPRGKAVFTLSELSGKEQKIFAMLKTLADVMPDPIIKAYLYNYALMKHSGRRRRVKELLAVVGGKAWRLLQNINLGRVRKVQEESEF